MIALLPCDVILLIADFGGIDVRRSLGISPRRVALPTLPPVPKVAHDDDASYVKLCHGERALYLMYNAAHDIRQVWIPENPGVWIVELV
jgi:hypothetical protein